LRFIPNQMGFVV